MYREAIRLAHEAGDWRLEVIERVNACDLLREIGRHDEAARMLAELLESLQQRPVSDYDRVEAMPTHIGVLGESGRIDEAGQRGAARASDVGSAADRTDGGAALRGDGTGG